MAKKVFELLRHDRLRGRDEDLNTLQDFAKSLKASPQARAQEEGNVTEVLAKAIRAARLHFESLEKAT